MPSDDQYGDEVSQETLYAMAIALVSAIVLSTGLLLRPPPFTEWLLAYLKVGSELPRPLPGVWLLLPPAVLVVASTVIMKSSRLLAKAFIGVRKRVG